MDQSNINMGLGKLADPNLVICRKNRWTVESKFLDRHTCNEINIDYYNHSIKLVLLDIVWMKDESKPQPNAIFWFERVRVLGMAPEDKVPDEPLIFKTFDGCGTLLYSQAFSQLSLKGCTTSCNYDNGGILTHEVTVGYRTYKTTYFGANDKKPLKKGKILSLKKDRASQMEFAFSK